MDEKPKIIKIVVTGLGYVEIVRFVASITDVGVIPTDNNDSASTLNFGRFDFDSQKYLYIFTNHNRPIHEFLWEILAEGLFGLIVLADCSVPESFSSLRNLLNTSTYYTDCPLVIAATKQDKEGAWDVEDLRIILRIPPEIPIIPCIATDKKSVANVLIALCEEALCEIDADEAEI